MLSQLEQRNILVMSARKYVGVKFLHAGRNEFGMDCIGLIICSGRDAGLLTDYDNVNYSSVVNSSFFRSQVEMFCCVVDIHDIEVGDILMFSMRGTSHTTTHVGLYIGNEQFLHSNQSVGKVVVEQLDTIWNKRLMTAYRWKQWVL